MSAPVDDEAIRFSRDTIYGVETTVGGYLQVEGTNQVMHVSHFRWSCAVDTKAAIAYYICT